MNGKWIIKSGTDFRNFTLLTISLSPEDRQILDVETKLLDVTSKYEPDKQLDSSLEIYRGRYFVIIQKNNIFKQELI